MREFDEIQAEHARLLQQVRVRNQTEGALEKPTVLAFIRSLRQETSDITDIQDRVDVRNISQYWANYVDKHFGEYPDVFLDSENSRPRIITTGGRRGYKPPTSFKNQLRQPSRLFSEVVKTRLSLRREELQRILGELDKVELTRSDIPAPSARFLADSAKLTTSVWPGIEVTIRKVAGNQRGKTYRDAPWWKRVGRLRIERADMTDE
jgi:hypothetical protein